MLQILKTENNYNTYVQFNPRRSKQIRLLAVKDIVCIQWSSAQALPSTEIEHYTQIRPFLLLEDSIKISEAHKMGRCVQFGKQLNEQEYV